MKIMASPWSPPGWMKTTGSMIGGSLKTENYPTMAKYFVKYVQAYGAHKIPIYAVTPQNEPGYSPTRYPGCLYSASAQITFIRDHLAPAFTAAGLSTKIMCYDHNYDGWSIPLQILANEATRNVTAGAAFHHYGGDPSMMTSLHEYFPARDIWFTEGGIGDWNNTFDNIAHEMISIPRNWAKSIIFWNAALDQDDGPALIGVNNTNQGMVTIRSDTQDNVTYNAQYYYMGHLSKFVKPGAWRVDSPNWDGTLESVAFRNPDNSLVLVVFNKQSSQSSIRIQWLDKAVQATLPAKSLTTFFWNAKPLLTLTQAGGTVVAGTPTTLAVSNAGGMAVTYQWKRNGVAIEGATSAQLTLAQPSSLDAGQYTCVATATDGATSEVSTDLVVTPLLTTNTAARLVNISTRSQVAGGEGTQTVGFVIEGTQSKRILLRAAGPALAPWLSNFIPNPRLRLNDVTRGLVVTENDDWDHDTIFATAHALQAFDWTAGSKDAALLVTLEPGLYTAEVSDAAGATGIALVEAYEADGSSRCVNISTRSPVGPGFDNQVAGFVIKGTGIKTVLIRASGPALKQWLSGTLEDPVLEVFNDKGIKVFENDNWDAASVHSIAQSLRAFDWVAGSKDAALIVSLPAGLYTATVKGANAGTGVALVEVYEVNK
jgi:O-glycosyl hydrolase